MGRVRLRDIIILASIVAIVFLLALLTTYIQYFGPVGEDIRFLGKLYLVFTNNEDKSFTTSSLEPVGAIVWDFRGLDTFFETVVFATAIIAIFSLYRQATPHIERATSFTLIVKLITVLLFPISLAVSSSIAFHGSISPGGGFQAGAIATVPALLSFIVFSYRYILRIGPQKIFISMMLGLICISIVAFVPVIYGIVKDKESYFMQNQQKPDSPFSYFGNITGMNTGGSIILFNIFEYVAVASGFLLAFFLLLFPEYIKASKEIEGEAE